MLHLYQYAHYYYRKAAYLRPLDARMWGAVGNCLLKLGMYATAGGVCLSRNCTVCLYITVCLIQLTLCVYVSVCVCGAYTYSICIFSCIYCICMYFLHYIYCVQTIVHMYSLYTTTFTHNTLYTMQYTYRSARSGYSELRACCGLWRPGRHCYTRPGPAVSVRLSLCTLYYIEYVHNNVTTCMCVCTVVKRGR